MSNRIKKDPSQQSHQQGAPQNTQDMPSSGNTAKSGGPTMGTDDGRNFGGDVEPSGSGTVTQRAPEHGETTGDPSRTPNSERNQ